jgi:MFS family permease
MNTYQANPVVAFLCLACPVLSALVVVGIAASLPAMAAHFGGGAEGEMFSQAVMVVPAVMIIIGAPLSGFAAQRVGRRACLLTALMLYALGGTAGLYCSSYWELIASRLLLGLGAGGTMASNLAIIGEHYTGAARERMLGFASGASCLAAVLVPIAGGALVDRFGWHAPFAFYSLGLLLIPATWYAVKAQPARKQSRAGSPSAVALLAVWPFYLLLLVFTIAIFTPSMQLPFLLEEKGESSAAAYGLVLSVGALTAGLGSFGYGYSRRLLGERGMYAMTALTFGGGAIAAACSDTTSAILVWSAVMGIGMGTVQPVTASAILTRTPGTTHDRAMGLLVSAMFMGQFVAPWIFGLVRRPFGIEHAFAYIGSAFVLLGALVLSGRIVPSVTSPRVDAANAPVDAQP